MGVNSILVCLVWQIAVVTSIIDVKLPITHLLGVTTPKSPILDEYAPNIPRDILPIITDVNTCQFSLPSLVALSSRTLPNSNKGKQAIDTDLTSLYEKITSNPYLAPNVLYNDAPQLQVSSSVKSLLENAYKADAAEYLYSSTIFQHNPLHKLKPSELFAPICFDDNTSQINSTPLPPVVIAGTPIKKIKSSKPTIHVAKTFEYTPSESDRKNVKTVTDYGEVNKSSSSNPREYIRYICDRLSKILNPTDEVFLSVSSEQINIGEEISKSIETLKRTTTANEMESRTFTPIIVGETIMPSSFPSIILQKSSPEISCVNTSLQSTVSASTTKLLSSVSDIVAKLSKDVTSSYESYFKAMSKVHAKLPYLPPINPYATPTLIKSNTASINFPPLNQFTSMPIYQRNIYEDSKWASVNDPLYLRPIPGQVLLTPISVKHYCTPHLSPSFLPSPSMPSYCTNISANDRQPVYGTTDSKEDIETFLNLILLTDLFESEESLDSAAFRSILASLGVS